MGDWLRMPPPEREMARRTIADLRARIKEADEVILAAYVSGHRDGWEPGPSVDETMHRLLCYLDNYGLSEQKERALAGEETNE